MVELWLPHTANLVWLDKETGNGKQEEQQGNGSQYHYSYRVAEHPVGVGSEVERGFVERGTILQGKKWCSFRMIYREFRGTEVALSCHVDIAEYLFAHSDRLQLQRSWEEEADPKPEQPSVLQHIDQVGDPEGSDYWDDSYKEPQQQSQNRVKSIFWFLGGVLPHEDCVDVVGDGVDKKWVGGTHVQGREEDEVVGERSQLRWVPRLCQIPLQWQNNINVNWGMQHTPPTLALGPALPARVGQGLGTRLHQPTPKQHPRIAHADSSAVPFLLCQRLGSPHNKWYNKKSKKFFLRKTKRI